jgi:transposase
MLKAISWRYTATPEQELANRLFAAHNYDSTAEQLNSVIDSADPAILAIVVARKDDNSLRIAEERQKDARDKLGVDVPIVFYDATNGLLEMVKEKLGNAPALRIMNILSSSAFQ